MCFLQSLSFFFLSITIRLLVYLRLPLCLSLFPSLVYWIWNHRPGVNTFLYKCQSKPHCRWTLHQIQTWLTQTNPNVLSTSLISSSVLSVQSLYSGECGVKSSEVFSVKLADDTVSRTKTHKDSNTGDDSLEWTVASWFSVCGEYSNFLFYWLVFFKIHTSSRTAGQQQHSMTLVCESWMASVMNQVVFMVNVSCYLQDKGIRFHLLPLNLLKPTGAYTLPNTMLSLKHHYSADMLYFPLKLENRCFPSRPSLSVSVMYFCW